MFKVPLQSVTMNDPIYFVGHCDLYFMILIRQFTL